MNDKPPSKWTRTRAARTLRIADEQSEDPDTARMLRLRIAIVYATNNHRLDDPHLSRLRQRWLHLVHPHEHSRNGTGSRPGTWHRRRRRRVLDNALDRWLAEQAQRGADEHRRARRQRLREAFVAHGSRGRHH